MVRVIMGVKGTGKTKQMIELINSAVHSENGNVVCIERGPKLTYDIHYKIRLVEASHYDIKSYDFLKGFISGLYAGNYDITHVFIDSLTKIVASEATDHAVEEFLDWLNSFSEKNNIKFTVTISADASLATDGVKKYFGYVPFQRALPPAGPAASFLPPSGVKSLVHPAYRRRTLDNIPIAWDYRP